MDIEKKCLGVVYERAIVKYNPSQAFKNSTKDNQSAFNKQR